MQICSLCYVQAPDNASHCQNCHADLSEFSNSSVALKRIQANDRIKFVRIIVADDCCPICRQFEGAHLKNEVEHLPIEGCSHNHGCRCFYQPVLEILYP